MFHLGDCLVDPATRRVCRGDEIVRLSPKAMAVLGVLYEAGGDVLSRAELLEEVWKGVTVGEEVLTHAIAELRRALGDSSRQPRYIETVHKSGYRLLLDQPVPAQSAGWLDLENHAAYLQGCELFFLGGPDNVSRAVAGFSDILDSDPTHARAYAGLAKSLFFMDRYFGLPGDNGDQIERCGRSAVAFGPALPETNAALGFALAASGKYDEALIYFATSVKLDANHAESHYLLGRACFAEGEYGLAATMLERAADLRADDFHSLVLAAKARRFMRDDLRWRNDLIKAKLRIDRHLALNPNDRRAICDKICCMVELGESKFGVRAATRLLDDLDPSHYYLICGLARAGETDLALDCLEAVIETGWSHGAWLIHDRDLDSLRQEPRFRRLSADVRKR